MIWGEMADAGNRLWSWKPKYCRVMVNLVKIRDTVTVGPGVMMIGSLDGYGSVIVGLENV